MVIGVKLRRIVVESADACKGTEPNKSILVLCYGSYYSIDDTTFIVRGGGEMEGGISTCIVENNSFDMEYWQWCKYVLVLCLYRISWFWNQTKSGFCCLQ